MQDKYSGKISTLHLLEGARQARGLAVIIDVFRAFSLECYFYSSGSLVNAKAIARYIIREQPPEVSLVCMGDGGVLPAVEDELCAEYIRSLLLGEDFPDMEQRIRHMIDHGAEKFFTPELQDVFPEQDFWLCTMCDRFDFVLKVEKDEIGYISRKINV